jgi:hypothetical protein
MILRMFRSRPPHAVPANPPRAGIVGWAVAAAAGVLLLLSLAGGDWPSAPSHGAGWPVPLSFSDSAWQTLLSVALGLLLALHPALAERRSRLSRWFFGMSATRFAWTLGGAAAVFYAAVSLLLFDGMPYLDDDVAALFQARVFASGRLTLPLPEHAEFFSLFGMLGASQNHPFVCTMYPPGLSLLLLPGVLAGVPWLVVPLLGGLLLVATVALGRELAGERIGRIAGLFMFVSPFVGVLAGTHLSHVPTALLLTLCWLQVARLLRTGGMRHGWGAGSAWGLAFLCRPMCALVVGLVMAIGVLLQWRRAWVARRGVLAALLMAVLAVGLLLLWQQATTSDPLTPGHRAGMGARASMGFIEYHPGRTHTPAKALAQTLARMRAVNDQLLGWPLPALLLALLPFLSRRFRFVDLWLVLAWLALLAVYAIYWYWEEYWPARYTSAAAPMLLILAAQGWVGWRAAAGRRARSTALACLSVGLVYAAGVAWPSAWARIGRNPGDMDRLLPRTLRAYGVDRGVVFMRSIGRAETRGEVYNDYYAAGFLRNPLDLDGPLIFARNRRQENEALMTARPEGPFYLYTHVRGDARAELDKYVRTSDGWKLQRVGRFPPGPGDPTLPARRRKRASRNQAATEAPFCPRQVPQVAPL